ncbi:MAG: SOS response-associated peptidase family protein, partial [Pseudomonadota bacterium]
MCNLYRMEGTREAMVRLARQLSRELTTTPETDNLAPSYVGANSDGLILRPHQDGLELAQARWGFPPISERDKQGRLMRPITNIRNLESRWWTAVNREWLLEPAYRCLVPFTRFAEWDKAKKANAWFEVIGTETPCFAGIWRPWHGKRSKIVGDWELFAFLTTEPNEVVAPIHPKAMPRSPYPRKAGGFSANDFEPSIRLFG